jgi:hypothetical protein
MNDTVKRIIALFNSLTWGKVLMTVILIVVGSAATIFIAARQEIGAILLLSRLDASSVPLVLTEPLSNESLNAIDDFMEANLSVSIISILSVDLPANTRTPIYREFNSAAARREAGNVPLSATVLPFLSVDPVQNAQMQSLLDGEFRCDNTEDLGFVVSIPSLLGLVAASCRVPIPPFRGKLSGYISVHLDKSPTGIYRDILRSRLTQLSTQINIAESKKKIQR